MRRNNGTVRRGRAQPELVVARLERIVEHEDECAVRPGHDRAKHQLAAQEIHLRTRGRVTSNNKRPVAIDPDNVESGNDRLIGRRAGRLCRLFGRVRNADL
ncbi:MAG: hypothetical protein DIU65_05580 [Proteobacteria bacterium]|nr:MAG: hypothetical protein DIU65_05580 [Pseudomonadota bacterium]